MKLGRSSGGQSLTSRLSFRAKLLLVLFVPFLALVVVAAAGLSDRFTALHAQEQYGDLSGPLHSLDNRWWFKPHEKGAHVRYWIAYEFKNPVLQAAISANKDKLASRIMQAFEREAKRRLG